jgi:predicted MPP superfamily phosphohydrolase
MRIRKFLPFLALVLWVAFCGSWAWAAQKPYYYPNADRLFWFMFISDTHIGANSTCAENLTWAVNEARQVIAPQFIVNTGDLTDSTDGGLIPDGPYQAEWDRYRQILESAGINSSFYYDMPGNHDEYNDGTLAYYRANSIQGRATGLTQPSWTRQFSYGS